MLSVGNRRFEYAMFFLLDRLAHGGADVVTQTWQSQDVSARPEMNTIELENVMIEVNAPLTMEWAQEQIKPNLPWAEVHFQERVGGEALNPPPSTEIWPFKQNGHTDHTDQAGQFSHTYPERFWPRHAGHDSSNCPHAAEVKEGRPEGYYSKAWDCSYGSRKGIRFPYGDLLDVLCLLKNDPHTRQAYLPIFFPEDTGAASGQRIPCSLGYQFMIRNNKLNCTYTLRSCDLIRHFRDDAYMAVRLMQWVQDRLLMPEVTVGKLVMQITSLHAFQGDFLTIADQLEKTKTSYLEVLGRAL